MIGGFRTVSLTSAANTGDANTCAANTATPPNVFDAVMSADTRLSRGATADSALALLR